MVYAYKLLCMYIYMKYFVQIAQQMTAPTPLPNYEEKKDFVYKCVRM